MSDHSVHRVQCTIERYIRKVRRRALDRDLCDILTTNHNVAAFLKAGMRLPSKLLRE